MMKPQRKLHDGRMVDNDSNEWKLECLAIAILAKPFEERQRVLAEYESNHGQLVANKLRAVIQGVFNARKDTK